MESGKRLYNTMTNFTDYNICDLCHMLKALNYCQHNVNVIIDCS